MSLRTNIVNKIENTASSTLKIMITHLGQYVECLSHDLRFYRFYCNLYYYNFNQFFPGHSVERPTKYSFQVVKW